MVITATMTICVSTITVTARCRLSPAPRPAGVGQHLARLRLSRATSKGSGRSRTKTVTAARYAATASRNGPASSGIASARPPCRSAPRGSAPRPRPGWSRNGDRSRARAPPATRGRCPRSAPAGSSRSPLRTRTALEEEQRPRALRRDDHAHRSRRAERSPRTARPAARSLRDPSDQERSPGRPGVNSAAGSPAQRVAPSRSSASSAPTVIPAASPPRRGSARPRRRPERASAGNAGPLRRRCDPRLPCRAQSSVALPRQRLPPVRRLRGPIACIAGRSCCTGGMQEIAALLREYDRARAYTDALWRDLTPDELTLRAPTRTPVPSAGTSATRRHVAHFMIRNLTAAEPSPDPELDGLMDSAQPERFRGALPTVERLTAFRDVVAERVHARIGDIGAGRVGAPAQLSDRGHPPADGGDQPRVPARPVDRRSPRGRPRARAATRSRHRNRLPGGRVPRPRRLTVQSSPSSFARSAGGAGAGVVVGGGAGAADCLRAASSSAAFTTWTLSPTWR